MTGAEYRQRKKELEYLIAYNKRIRCVKVAAKWERELEKLEKQWRTERRSE